MKAKLFAFAKIAVTVLLFLYVFNDIDFQQFGATLKNARPGILILGFLVIWIAHYICIYRWRMLMRPLMPVLSMARLFGIYCIGLFFNLTFPTVVGGDVVKMYYAGRPSKMYAQSFAATFLDRDAGMLAMLIIACTAILIHPVAVPGIPVSADHLERPRRLYSRQCRDLCPIFSPPAHRVCCIDCIWLKSQLKST